MIATLVLFDLVKVKEIAKCDDNMSHKFWSDFNPLRPTVALI